MNVNSLITKDYRKKDDFAVRKNKANSKPISVKPKMNVTSFITKYYENKWQRRVRKNKANSNPIQTQSPNPRFYPQNPNVSTSLTQYAIRTTQYENACQLGVVTFFLCQNLHFLLPKSGPARPIINFRIP